MSAELVTVEVAAEELQLHPKTVLRFIRDGRLKASKVGKQYRIQRSDLRAFVGAVAPRPAAAARVTSVVDITGVDDTLVHRLSTVLLASINTPDARGDAISMNIAHDPLCRTVKVILVAAPADTAALLRLVDACIGDAP
jgi:excisionase family DNA binding protein